MPEDNVISVDKFGKIPNYLRDRAKKILNGENLSTWLDYLKRINDAGFGEQVSKGFSEAGIEIIEKHGINSIKIFYSVITSITIKKNQKIAYHFSSIARGVSLLFK